MSADNTAPPLIVSLQFDAATVAELDRLRRRYFPPERNHLTAHLTLFHHLPGENEQSIVERLTASCEVASPMPLSLPSPRFLGRGVAIEVDCPRLLTLRATLAESWQPWLTPQDRQKFRPHVTIQNKVDPAVAKRLFERLRKTWTFRGATATGLLLHRYRGGPWESIAAFPFVAATRPIAHDSR